MRKCILKEGLLILSLMIGLNSCSDDDNGHADESKLFGGWSYSGKKEVKINATGLSDEEKRAVSTFIRNSYQPYLLEGDCLQTKDDGSLVAMRCGKIWMKDLTYTYTKSDGLFKIFKSSQSEPSVVYEVVNVSQNEAVLKYTYNLGEIYGMNTYMGESEGKIVNATAFISLTREIN